MIKEMNKEMDKQVDKIFRIKEIVDRLNDMGNEDKRFYRDALILTILHYTSKDPIEAIGILEINKLALHKSFIKES